MTTRKLRIAMIGYQFMGRTHSNAWRQVARFFDTPFEPVLQVVCGRNEAEVSAASRKLGFEAHATTWQEVVARDDIDVVDICTPGDSHLPIVLAAAAAGKSILCEKPLANELAEAEQMLGAAQSAGIVHMLCHNYRRAPAVQLAKRLIDEGRLGRIHHYRGTYLQDWIVDPEFPRVWRLEKARAGSGALGDIASHSLDLARFLVGEICEVSGLLETFVAERPLEDGSGRGPVDVDDAALALLRFENGAIGTVEGTRFAPGRKNHNRFEINGSKGSLVFDLERMNELELYEEDGSESGFRTILATDPSHPYVAAWWPPGHIIGYEHTFIHTVLDFMRGIEAGRSPEPNFEDGVKNQRLLDTIERSHTNRRWEQV
ncbi:MAG: Gfo/Idh/MocA family oxidoreductase [Deltaproteobacteria bacterium]|nr:Gfo/Idh/MocA family oxidoreductase [Deltaproteobacteria bacterium]MBW2395660.1 Gfo/Idh/MocA family oxidoreductase [Deltaproteobacteria bacterium]